MTDDKSDNRPSGASHPDKEPTPKDELTAALAHLRSAADLLAKRIDPAVRKAAKDAEGAMERVASETEKTANEIQAAAKPFASKIGLELGKLADEIKKSVSHLEQSVKTDEGEKTAEKKGPPDPDDPGSLR